MVGFLTPAAGLQMGVECERGLRVGRALSPEDGVGWGGWNHMGGVSKGAVAGLQQQGLQAHPVLGACEGLVQPAGQVDQAQVWVQRVGHLLQDQCPEAHLLTEGLQQETT